MMSKSDASSIYVVPVQYKIYGISEGMTYNWEEDNYWIRNNFKPLKATRDGEFVDIGEVINSYMDFLENKEIYWETDNLYSKIDSIIVIQKYPLLSQDYIATYYDTKFLYEF